MKFTIWMLFLFLIACNGKTEVIENNTEDKELGLVTVDFEGLQDYMENHKAETLVVNFWATWCKPCIKELPAFERLRTEYEDKDVAVILVSLDFPDQMERLTTFIAKKNILSEVVFLDDGNANEWIPKVDERWSGAIPATLILTKKNKKFYERSFTYAELQNELESHIDI